VKNVQRTVVKNDICIKKSSSKRTCFA